jgi:hypothetical protein
LFPAESVSDWRTNGERKETMKDDDDRQAKEEEALKQFMDGYSRLVAIMARHVADGTKAEEVTEQHLRAEARGVEDARGAGQDRGLVMAAKKKASPSKKAGPSKRKKKKGEAPVSLTALARRGRR